MHFAPVIFHTLDMTINQAQIIASYQKKPKSFMCLWALTSFALFGFLFEVFMVVTNSTFGHVSDDEELDSSSTASEEGYGSSSSNADRTNVFDHAAASPPAASGPALFDAFSILNPGEPAETTTTNLARFLYHSRMFSLTGAIFALFILYFMILKRAYFRTHHKAS